MLEVLLERASTVDRGDGGIVNLDIGGGIFDGRHGVR